MDSGQFDTLARTLAFPSRRGVLFAALSGAIAALFGHDAADEGFAKRKHRNGQKKRQHPDEHNRLHASKKKHKKKKKPCKGGTTKCGKRCVNTASDPANCGRCGNACPSGARCASGRCEVLCGASVCQAGNFKPDCCDDTCTNLRTDRNHCGDCETACAADKDCCAGSCVDTSSDRDNCGGCGRACGAGETCVDVHCGVTCGTDAFCLADSEAPNCCNDQCTNTERDREHCGACGHACAETERCWNGVCVCGDICASGCQFTSFGKAINAANDGDTLTIAPGIYDQGEISIHKSLTLRRCGTDGEVTLRNGTDGGYSISNTVAAVHLVDLVITRNPQFDFGGGILNFGGLTLTNCTVTGCSRPDHVVAGGIQNSGTLTMHGGAITHNTAISGAGIHNEASNGGSLTLIDCDVSHNVAFGGSGGGISSFDDRTTLTLTNCTINDNTAEGGGAGIENSGAATLTNTTISGNRSTHGYGGGIVTNGLMSLTDCTVTDNFAGESGGGIYSANTVTLLGTTTVTGNTPNNCDGPTPVAGCVG